MLIEGLYEITAFDHEACEVSATVKLNKHHRIFEGHFPGHPVLPGVCVIQMVQELTEKALGKTLLLTVASNVKFMAVINPEKNETIHFNLELMEVEGETKVKNSVRFDETLALKLNATLKNADK